jgi:transposase-like protein
MEKLPRQVYTDEFCRQAAEMITREGLSIAEAARRLSISPKTLLNWVRRAKARDLPSTGAGATGTRSQTRRLSFRGCGGRKPNCGWSATS